MGLGCGSTGNARFNDQQAPRHAQIQDLTIDPDPAGVRFKKLKTGKTEGFKCNGLFIAIGHEPNSKLLAGQLDLDPTGHILTHDGSKTNVPGVFACGDVQDDIYRQAITAAGSGCMAALDAERWLETQH